MTRFLTKNTSLHDSQKNVTLSKKLVKDSREEHYVESQVTKNAESGVAGLRLKINSQSICLREDSQSYRLAVYFS